MANFPIQAPVVPLPDMLMQPLFTRTGTPLATAQLRPSTSASLTRARARRYTARHTSRGREPHTSNYSHPTRTKRPAPHAPTLARAQGRPACRLRR